MRKRYITLLGGALAGLLTFLLTINRVEPSHVGLTRNLFTGEITVQTAGVYVTSPFVTVANIDTRPMRVCVPTTAHPAPSCKLVQFVPEYAHDFVRTEGWSYYWFRNRLSFNSGYETLRGLPDIMRGYAFTGQRYRFISVIEEYR